MIYTCNKCNKEFNQKSHYESHLRRKFSCVKNLESILDENNNFNITQNLPPNNAKIPPNNAKNLNNESSIICEFCNKYFARKDNLTKHQKTRCKIKNNLDDTYDKLKEKVNLLTEQNNNLNKQLSLTMKKKNKLIISNPSNISNTNNTTNNTTNTNNGQIIQNQQNINIKMVSFGEEDFNRLTEEEILNVLKSKNRAFFNLVKLIHLNERLPEYNNILINNFPFGKSSIFQEGALKNMNVNIHIFGGKSNYGSIFDETKMIVQQKKQIIADLITNRLYDLQQLVIKYKQTKHLSKREIEILGSVIGFLKNSNLEDEDVDGNIIRPDKETTKKIKELYDELILMFYNDRDLVEQTLKQLTSELDTEILYLDV